MSYFGGLSSTPLRFGGGRPMLQVILDSINSSMGTGYIPDPTSIVYVRNLALAKVILQAWSTNQRLANNGNPSTLTTLLTRWEHILALPVDPSLSDVARRARALELWSRNGQAFDTQYLTDKVSGLLGPVFVAIEFISYANAVVHSPDGTYPWGTQTAGYPWYSTVAHILIRTQKPTGWNEGQYRAAVGKANALLDAIVPAWVTWTAYHPPEGRSPTNTPGGPSAGGIFCDTPNTLDYCVFP